MFITDTLNVFISKRFDFRLDKIKTNKYPSWLSLVKDKPP